MKKESKILVKKFLLLYVEIFLMHIIYTLKDRYIYIRMFHAVIKLKYITQESGLF